METTLWLNLFSQVLLKVLDVPISDWIRLWMMLLKIVGIDGMLFTKLDCNSTNLFEWERKILPTFRDEMNCWRTKIGRLGSLSDESSCAELQATKIKMSSLLHQEDVRTNYGMRGIENWKRKEWNEQVLFSYLLCKQCAQLYTILSNRCYSASITNLTNF